MEDARICAAQRDGAIMALSPEVMQALDQAGVRYRTPEEFVNVKALNEIGLANYAHLEALGESVENWMRGLEMGMTVNPVFAHFYRLKLFLDSVALRLAESIAVLRVLSPSKVIVPESTRESFFADPATWEFLTCEGPVYSVVVPFVGKSLGVDVEWLPATSKPNVRRFLPPRMQQGRAWASVFRDALRVIMCVGDRLFQRKALWFIGGLSHDLPDIARAAQGKGSWRLRDLSFWARHSGKWYETRIARNSRNWTQMEESLLRAWGGLRERLAQNPLFWVENVSYFPLVESQLQRLCTQGLVEAERCFHAARHLVRSSRIQCLLGIHTGNFRDAIMCLAMKAEGVPVVYVQEGGLYGYCESPMHHYMELSFSDRFLAYGPGIVNYLAVTRLTGRQQSRPLAVGGFRFRALQMRHETTARANGGATRVMYIPTEDFHHSIRYAPLNYSDREYYRIKRHVLKALLDLPNVRVTYKVPPGTAASDSCRTFVSEHRGRITVLDEPLPAVLDKAEIFLVDWPTTVLLEVLTTAKPVLVLIDPVVCRPIPEAMALLRRRALVSDSIESFVEMARSLIKDREGTLKNIHLTDTAFLDAYGTGGEAGWTAAQLARFFASV